MEQEKLNGRFLIHLAMCGLKGKKADKVWDGIDMTEVLKKALKQKIGAMAYLGIGENIVLDEEIKKRFIRANDKAMWMHSMQEIEKEFLFEAFEKNNIRFMPLKGVIMKDIYQMGYIRTMSDMDILVDDENTPKVKEIMESLGYETMEYMHGTHDKYEKDEKINVEIHRRLMDKNGHQDEMRAGFNNVWDDKYVVYDENNKMLVKQSPEEFYVFMVSHAAKHFFNAGFGVRFIFDIGVYREKYLDTLDVKYITERFKQMKILKFAETIEKLADIWMSGEIDLSSDTIYDKAEISKEMKANMLEMERMSLGSSVYGDTSQKAVSVVALYDDNISSKKSLVFKTTMNRIFLPRIYMAINYPIVGKCGFLLPLFWIIRLIKWPFTRHKGFKDEVSSLKGIDYDTYNFKNNMKEY